MSDENVSSVESSATESTSDTGANSSSMNEFASSIEYVDEVTGTPIEAEDEGNNPEEQTADPVVQPEAATTPNATTATKSDIFSDEQMNDLVSRFSQFKPAVTPQPETRRDAQPVMAQNAAPSWKDELKTYIETTRQAYLGDLNSEYNALAQAGNIPAANAIAKLINDRSASLDQHFEDKRLEMMDAEIQNREKDRMSETDNVKLATNSKATIEKVASELGGRDIFDKLVIGSKDATGKDVGGYGRNIVDMFYRQYLNATNKQDTTANLQHWYKSFTSNEDNVRFLVQQALSVHASANINRIAVDEAKRQITQSNATATNARTRRPSGAVTSSKPSGVDDVNTWIKRK